MILEDEGAHAAALRELRQVNSINRSGHPVGIRVCMHVDRAVESLGPRTGNSQCQHDNEHVQSFHFTRHNLPSLEMIQSRRRTFRKSPASATSSRRILFRFLGCRKACTKRSTVYLCSAEVDGVDPARIGNVVQRICVQHYEVCTLAARYGTAGQWGESEKSWVPVHRAPKVDPMRSLR